MFTLMSLRVMLYVHSLSCLKLKSKLNISERGSIPILRQKSVRRTYSAGPIDKTILHCRSRDSEWLCLSVHLMSRLYSLSEE